VKIVNLRGYEAEYRRGGPSRRNHARRWQIRHHRCVLRRLPQTNSVANPYELREALQRIQPSKLTKVLRRVWLLESIRANMLYYASEIDLAAVRWCSLPGDGVAPAFSMCNEMRDSILEDVNKIRATYGKDWVTNQLRTRPNRDSFLPNSEAIITNAVVAQHRQRLALGAVWNLSRPILGNPPAPAQSDLADNVARCCTGKVDICGQMHLCQHVAQETTGYESVRSGQVFRRRLLRPEV
jgi:hypothetical protein